MCLRIFSVLLMRARLAGRLLRNITALAKNRRALYHTVELGAIRPTTVLRKGVRSAGQGMSVNGRIEGKKGEQKGINNVPNTAII
jgi:hypothetical protein